jgi:8-oxo-dGTP pyrophosphatase MutT (NUDIX family)
VRELHGAPSPSAPAPPPPALLQALERHVGSDEKEKRDRDAIVALLRRGDRAFARGEFEPGHITGSAFVLDAKGEKLLLVHHAKLDRWLQPGGHCEPGETDGLATALREATEETGIAGLLPHPTAPQPFDVDIHTIPARKGDPQHDHHDVRYLLVAPEGATTTLSEESHALAWRSLAEACGPDADAAFRRAVGKIRLLTFRPSRCPR